MRHPRTPLTTIYCSCFIHSRDLHRSNASISGVIPQTPLNAPVATVVLVHYNIGSRPIKILLCDTTLFQFASVILCGPYLPYIYSLNLLNGEIYSAGQAFLSPGHQSVNWPNKLWCGVD